MPALRKGPGPEEPEEASLPSCQGPPKLPGPGFHHRKDRNTAFDASDDDSVAQVVEGQQNEYLNMGCALIDLPCLASYDGVAQSMTDSQAS